MKEHLKAIAFILIAILPPFSLYLLYLTFWWLANVIRRKVERRHGIVHELNEMCRCGVWYGMHHRLLGTPDGCMWFRRAR